MLSLARLAASLTLAAALAGAAFAAGQDINLTATVPGTCTISDSASPSAITQNLTIDSQGKVSTSPIVISFPVSCNKTATLALTSTNKGLTGPAPMANFTNHIDYIAQTSGLFPAVTLNSAIPAAPLPDGGNPTSSSSDGPVQGTLTLAVTPAPNTGPLVSGNYADILRLTIVPQQ